MENLNAEQIKKALECCTEVGGCYECPYGANRKGCKYLLLCDALALINSQEQRIGAQDITISELRQRCDKAEHDADRYAQRIKGLEQCLEHEHASFMETFGEYGEKCDRLAEENENLHASCTEFERKCASLTEENERLRAQNVTLEQKLMLLGIDDVYVFKAQVKGE